MPFVGRRSREIIEDELPEITWEHSHVVVEPDGNVLTYCVYDAPDEERSWRTPSVSAAPRRVAPRDRRRRHGGGLPTGHD